MRAMTFKIHHEVGMDGRLDLQRTADTIESLQIHVVGLQEVIDGSPIEASSLTRPACCRGCWECGWPTGAVADSHPPGHRANPAHRPLVVDFE